MPINSIKNKVDKSNANFVKRLKQTVKQVMPEEYKKYYLGFKTGGKTKHKIEAEGGEVIQSNKPFKIKKGGIAIPLGNGYNLLQGNTHEQGGIDIDMKGEGKIWSNIPMINGKSPAKRLIDGENPNELFIKQELIKNISGLNDDGSIKRIGGFSNKTKSMIKELLNSNEVLNPAPINPKPFSINTTTDFNVPTINNNDNELLNATKKHLEDKRKIEKKSNPNTTINNDSINLIMKDEGFSSKIYKDGNGRLTVGYGETDPKKIEYVRNLEKQGKQLTEEEAKRWVIERNNNFINQNIGVSNNKILPEVWNNLNNEEQAVIQSIIYNGGRYGSPKMIEAINEGRWDDAIYEMNIGIGDPKNKGNTIRRMRDQMIFRDRMSDEYKLKFNPIYEYIEQNDKAPTLNQDVFDMVDKLGLYNRHYNKFKNRKLMGGYSFKDKLDDNNSNGLIYYLNGNVKNGSRYLPFKGERVKAKLGLTTGDWINAGTNLLGSLLSFGHNYAAAKNKPKLAEPVLKQAEKLNTRYNINPQLNMLNETEAAAYKDINLNSNSSNTALARRQGIRLNSLLNKSLLYDKQVQEENKLINSDKLNRQGIANTNIDTYNNYLDKLYERDKESHTEKLTAVNDLINNLSGTVNNVVNRYEERKDNKNNVATQLDLLNIKFGNTYKDIFNKIRKRYGIEISES